MITPPQHELLVRQPCPGCWRFCDGCKGVPSPSPSDPDADTVPIELPRTDRSDAPSRKDRMG